MDLVKYLLFIFAVVAVIKHIFEQAEKSASNPVRAALVDLLQPPEQGLKHTAANWIMLFSSMFHSVFGDRHLSLKCFSRSAYISIALTLSLSVLAFNDGTAREIVRDEGWHALILTVGSFLWHLLPFVLSVTVVADYLSLGVTRWVVRQVNSADTTLRIAGLLLLDLVASALLPMTLFSVISALIWRFSLAASTRMIPMLFLLHARASGGPGMVVVIPPFGSLFYPTFFSSAWLCIFIVGGPFTRFIARSRLLVAPWLKIKEQPFASLGMVLMACTVIAGVSLYALRAIWCALI